MAPTLVTTPYYVECADKVNGDTTTLVTPSFTPSNGEVIIVKATTWDTATASGTPSGGSQTFTSRVTIAPGGFASYGRIFSAVISGSPGSMTITLSAPAAQSYHAMVVERWTSAQLAGTPATNGTSYSSASAPSATVTTVANNSIVSWLCADSQAVSPATRAYRSSATEDGLGDGSASTSGVFYFAYQTAASSGSQTYGLTAPTTLKWVLAAIEVQNGAAPYIAPSSVIIDQAVMRAANY